MAPILGIYASQISGHLFAPSGAYDSIATTTVGAGGAATVTFSSIPSTYTHLQIRCMMSDTGTGSASMSAQFNGDTGANYATHILLGNGSAASAAAITSDTKTFCGYFYQGTSTFGATVVDVLDYANTSKYKTLRSLSGGDANGNGQIRLFSGLWMNTGAVSSITLASNVGNFIQYSSFALYGIRGN
jgi:hypothetical protein